MPRPLYLLALPVVAAAPLASALPQQGSTHIRINGTVAVADPAAESPFGAAAVGDPWALEFDVIPFGNAGLNGQRFYDIIMPSMSLTSTGGTATIQSSAATLTMIRQVADAQYGTVIRFGSNVRFAIVCADQTDPYAFPTADITQLQGVYPSAEFQIVFLSIDTGSLELDLAQLEVGPTLGYQLGGSHCPSMPNSTGSGAVLTATGSRVVASNDVTLNASQMPQGTFGYFLVSPLTGFVPMPGGSAGTLCLGGPIGRYVGPGQVQQADAAGGFSLRLDLTARPTPTGPVPVVAGDLLRFQCWFRDTDLAGMPTSNFTNGFTVRFD